MSAQPGPAGAGRESGGTGPDAAAAGETVTGETAAGETVTGGAAAGEAGAGGGTVGPAATGQAASQAAAVRSGSQAGRSFLVTGGNTGIGLSTAMELARLGGRVYVACRSEAKGSAAVAAIVAATGNAQVSYLPLDLGDLASVRSCADDFLAAGQPLHVLINNAGVAGRGGLTSDGFELLFGVNHLGHFALTTALLDRLAESADGQPARVVTVASDAHYRARGIDFTALRRRTRGITGMRAYAVSKLCNVLFSQELARRAGDRGIATYAVHPGLVASDIWRQTPQPVRGIMTARMLTTEQGAQTSLYCATAAEAAGRPGLFWDNSQPREPSKVATPGLGAILWERSEAWTGG